MVNVAMAMLYLHRYFALVLQHRLLRSTILVLRHLLLSSTIRSHGRPPVSPCLSTRIHVLNQILMVQLWDHPHTIPPRRILLLVGKKDVKCVEQAHTSPIRMAFAGRELHVGGEGTGHQVLTVVSYRGTLVTMFGPRQTHTQKVAMSSLVHNPQANTVGNLVYLANLTMLRRILLLMIQLKEILVILRERSLMPMVHPIPKGNLHLDLLDPFQKTHPT